MTSKKIKSITPSFIVIIKLITGTLFGSALGTVTMLIIANNISIEMFGSLSSTISFYSLLVPVLGMGLGQFWLKKVRNNSTPHFTLSQNIIETYILNILFIFFGLTLLIYSDLLKISVPKNIFLLMYLYAIGQSSIELLNSFFQQKLNYSSLNLVHIFQNILRFFLIIFPLVFSMSLNNKYPFIVYSIVGVLTTTFLILTIKNQLNIKCFKITDFKKKILNNYQNLAIKSFPFALAAFFHLIYFQSDIFIISQILGDEHTAKYSAMFLIVGSTLIIPTSIYQKFLLPKVHTWSANDRKKLKQTINKGAPFMIFLGMLLTVLIIYFSSQIVSLLFSESYFGSTHILKIMSLNITLYYFSSNYGIVLLTKNLISKKVKVMGVVALLNIVLNIIFIPIFDLNAALFSTIVCNLIIAFSYYFLANREIKKTK